MINVIAVAVIGVIVGAAAGYVYKEKKRGSRCIGCPHARSCSGSCSGCADK